MRSYASARQLKTTGESNPSACPHACVRGDEEEGVSNCRRMPSRPLTVVTERSKTRSDLGDRDRPDVRRSVLAPHLPPVPTQEVHARVRNHGICWAASRRHRSCSTVCDGSNTAATTRPESRSRTATSTSAKPRARSSGCAVLLEAEPLDGTIGIGHTRWATHGEPSDVNAHPHTDPSGEFVVVHNGIIENFHQPAGRARGRGSRVHLGDRHRDPGAPRRRRVRRRSRCCSACARSPRPRAPTPWSS